MPGGASAGNATGDAVTPFEEASTAAALGELPAHAANLLADCLLACFALLMATRLLAFRPQPPCCCIEGAGSLLLLVGVPLLRRR